MTRDEKKFESEEEFLSLYSCLSDEHKEIFHHVLNMLLHIQNMCDEEVEG